jgi:LysR family nitrogen assimilation transcriptional regulator
MNRRQLDFFLAVVQFGTTTAAAVALNTSQPHVSREIGLLEKRWGGRLFERTGRGLQLSALGERMAPEVRALISQYERMEQLARDASGQVTGKVHLGLVPSIAEAVTAALLADLAQCAPGIRLQISEGFSGHLDELLAASRIDIGIFNRYGRRLRSTDDLVGRDVALLVGQADDKLLASKNFDFVRLAGLPLIVPPYPNDIRGVLDRHARLLGIELSIALEVDNLRSMKEACLAGHGYTILSSLGVQNDILSGALAGTKLVRPLLPRTAIISVSTRRPQSLACRFVWMRLRALAPTLIVPTYGS